VSVRGSVTAEATVQGKPRASKWVTGRMEVWPAARASTVAGQVAPSGVNAPSPRTKTRREVIPRRP